VTSMTIPREYSRIDASSGIREYVEYFGPDTSKLFGCTHMPAESPKSGVVLCCSVYAELLSNYRAEVILGRSLAARGVAAQRFHYRGCGHSDEVDEEFTFDTMCADAAAATRQLVERAGVTDIAFMGTRWGSLVAASLGATSAYSPLVLWEPVIDPVRYFREVGRFQLAHRVKKGGHEQPSPDGLIDALERTGSIEVLGYPIYRRFLESVRKRRLEDDLGAHKGPVLIMQMTRRRELRGGYADLVSMLERQGCRVEARVFSQEPAWWFVREPMSGLEKLANTTADWIVSNHSKEPVR
jgi:hypothetical protein